MYFERSIFIFCLLGFIQMIFPNKSVYVYHFMVPHWGESYDGPLNCSAYKTNVDKENYDCIWRHADHLKTLKQKYIDSDIDYSNNKSISISLYNIHSWWEKTRTHHPASCELHTNLTMVESEESQVRYNHLFEPSFKHYDGFSTTNPLSSVQRIYNDAFMYDLNTSIPVFNHTTLIKGASYVASDCHKRDNANANRDNIIHQLRLTGFRVDGLGRCMHSIGPGGFGLPNTHDSRYNLFVKRNVISHYMFYMAFENSLEPGYVTEKPFDGLISGKFHSQFILICRLNLNLNLLF